MGRKNISSPNRVQPNPRKIKPMRISLSKGLGTFLECLNNLLKLPTESSETLSQKKKVEKTFSPSHNMAKDVTSYWK